MSRASRTVSQSLFTRVGRGLVAFAVAATLVGCAEDEGATSDTTAPPRDIPAATVGNLNVNVNPPSATVEVTGPDNFLNEFIGNRFLWALTPGEYTAMATAPGFGDAEGVINVVAGQTSSISLVLQAKSIITEAPRAVYRDGKGNLKALDTTSVQSGGFVFYAWLDDEPAGILPAKLATAVVTDPGKPVAAEQLEFAPSFTQNLAGAWVGFADEDGVVRPVIGADVRWEIDQWWSGRVESMQFGTSDDNRVAADYGIFDDQADTRTNNARLAAAGFPLVASEFPLYNVTSVGTPFIDGFTWVTLFSPDAKASGRIVAVALINGEEIGKQILYKNFVPTPVLEITKTVDKGIVNLVDGEATVTWTVTIKNVGMGDAESVDLIDNLISGAAANYTLGPVPTGGVADGDGFDITFPLNAKPTPAPGNTKTLTFTATVTEAGTYCNEAQIVVFGDENSTWHPIDLKASACFTALESNVSIIKDFVAADETTSLGKSVTLATNQNARLRIRVVNGGSGAATGVAVNDELTSGDASKYTASAFSSGTANAKDGFDATIGNLAAGATATLFFTVSASADGTYCDTAVVTAAAGTNIGIGSDSACLTVATPDLSITKVDSPQSVLPGGSYTSTIVVTNNGNAVARNVVISDVLGLNSAANVRAIYVSSSLGGIAGTVSANVITAKTIDIPAGGSVTFIVVSRIPPGAIAGEYCDEATVTASNSPTKKAEDCVDVPSFSALQTQLIDLADPVVLGGRLSFFSVMFVESLSNEGVKDNELTYSFGLTSPLTLGIPGVFEVISSKFYLDTKPIQDPTTGLVVSDTSNGTAKLLVAGVDYTVDNSTPGLQIVQMKPNVVLMPGTALYAAHVVEVPTTAGGNRMYTTSYIWKSIGTVVAAHTYEASSSEPTTILP